MGYVGLHPWDQDKEYCSPNWTKFGNIFMSEKANTNFDLVHFVGEV